MLTHSEPPTTCCPLPIGPATSSKPRPLYKYHICSSLTILHTSHPAYEDGTDRVFRNVGIQQSDAGVIPKRIHTRLKRIYSHSSLLVQFFFVCVLLIKFYSQVKEAYINFLNHCYIDTEVEMKEIYTSNHMWSLFEKSFLVDMGHVANATHDRKHADTALENYIINSVMNIISTFFNSPFSDQSTTVQVGLLPCLVNLM